MRELQRIALHGLRTLRAVRNACRVAEVDNRFVWQPIAERLDHGKPANAGIKNADGSRVAHAAGKSRLHDYHASLGWGRDGRAARRFANALQLRMIISRWLSFPRGTIRMRLNRNGINAGWRLAMSWRIRSRRSQRFRS